MLAFGRSNSEKQMIKLKSLITENKGKRYKVELDGPYTYIEESDHGTSWAAAKREAIEYLKDHYENYRDALRDMRALRKSKDD